MGTVGNSGGCSVGAVVGRWSFGGRSVVGRWSVGGQSVVRWMMNLTKGVKPEFRPVQHYGHRAVSCMLTCLSECVKSVPLHVLSTPRPY